MRIGIAGAGIGGLSAAALLARDGHNVTVFDQFERPAPVGSGLVIQPVGQKVLAQILPWPILLELGQPITRMIGHEAKTGRKTLDVSYDRFGTDRFGLAVHRASLFDALLGRATSAGAKLVTSHKVTGVCDEKKCFCFADGSRTHRFQMLVDSLGAASPLSPLNGKTLRFGALWGTVDWPADSDLPADHLSQMYRRADRMLGVLPIGQVAGHTNPRATIFWSLPADAHQNWLDQPLDEWRAEATALWPQFAPFISQITEHNQMTMARYTHATQWRTPRDGLIHIGDAAHRASPQLGQGANMALLDAYALATTLQNPTTDPAAAYFRQRRLHVQFYQIISYAFTPMYQSNSRILPALRDRILAPMSQFSPIAWALSRLVCGDLIKP